DDVRRTDDALLAQVGRAPVDFELELVRLDDLRRCAKAFAELCEEGDVPMGGGLVVREPGVGELLRAGAGAVDSVSPVWRSCSARRRVAPWASDSLRGSFQVGAPPPAGATLSNT